MTSITVVLRRTTGITAAVLLCVFGPPAIASAHELKTDGTISTTLHIDPDDNPTAGRPIGYTLFFSDSTGRFSLPKCNCTVAITKSGKLVAGKPLTISGSEASENRYTFAEPGTYSLDFTGTPKTPDAFQPFKLDYQVRVGRQADTQTMPVAGWVGIGAAIGFVLLTAQLMHRAGGKTARRKRI